MNWSSFAVAVLVCTSQVLAGTVTVKSSADLPMIAAAPGSNRGLGGQHYWDNGDTMLLKFDLSSLPPGTVVKAGTLELFSGHEGPYEFDWQVTAHAMRVDWQEGIGTTSGVYGSIGYPWGPASLGDATFAYRQVTATGSTEWGGGAIVGTAGIPWEVPGALGTAQDCFPDLLIDQAVVGPLQLRSPGTSLAVLNLTPAGCNAISSWIEDPAANHGMVVLATGIGNWRVATREHSGTPGTPGPYAPLLTLELGQQGDVDGDGHVDVVDLLYLVDAFGSVAGEANYDSRCDFNSDDAVDVVDLLTLVEYFGA